MGASNCRVAILMGTYNGLPYIEKLLDSLEAQKHTNWCLIVSDDGSSDNTIEVLEQRQNRLGSKISIMHGPQNGFSKNFLSLAANSAIRSDYYAFCDQDDVWCQDKLSKAVEMLQRAGESPERPIMYCGATWYVTDSLVPCGRSQRFVYPKTFNNALVQNIASGNTMVFNHPAKVLLEKAGVVNVPYHDWWLYLIVTGAGGVVLFDDTPQIFYRQHSLNQVGVVLGFKQRMWRFLRMFFGVYRGETDLNLEALRANANLLDESSRKTLGLFVRLRNFRLMRAIYMACKCKLYRQTWRGTLTLYLGIAFKKI